MSEPTPRKFVRRAVPPKAHNHGEPLADARIITLVPISLVEEEMVGCDHPAFPADEMIRHLPAEIRDLFRGTDTLDRMSDDLKIASRYASHLVRHRGFPPDVVMAWASDWFKSAISTHVTIQDRRS